MAVNSFFEAERQSGVSNLPLNPQQINNAMRFANKTMSEDKIKSWLDRYSGSLCWRAHLKRAMKEKHVKCMNRALEKYVALYPHEFLFLICNATERSGYVFPPIGNPSL